MLANKQDDDDAVPVDEVDDAMSLNSLRNNRPVEIFGISALSGDGIKEVMTDLASRIKEHHQGH